MRRAIRVVALLLSLCTSILLPANVAAASGVPQAVLDMRGSVVRVVCLSNDSSTLGSGFAIGKDSVEYIVTNYHVVEDNPNRVIVLRGDDQVIAAKPYVSLPERDLCVLKLSVPQYDMQPFELFDKETARVGEAVYTLGFPAAADVLSGEYTAEPGNVTVTSGIVSALKSWELSEIGTYVDIVQIDAPISAGNSGGPLVNEHGQVLGVNTLTVQLESQNINGAVSILELTDALINNRIPFISASAPNAGNDAFPIYLTAGICLFVVAATAVLLFAIPRRKKKGIKGKSAGLAEYLRQWGGRLPYDMAIRVLEPALRELASMHAQGRCHGDVCPENIRVAGNNAILLPPAGTGGKLLLRPGFSAPEQFRADGRLGPWSDVYSICAVIFYMVTGANPPGAVERQMAGGEGGFGFGNASIGDAQAAVVYSGLMLDAAKRPQNCVELLAALGLPPSAATLPMAGAAAATGDAPTKAPRARKRGGKRKLIAAVSVFVVLCGAAIGFYVYEDACYNDAVARISEKDYKGGIEKLTYVVPFFKDCEKWRGYAHSGLAMQSNRFDEARAGFRALGDFSDARTMIRETSYQEALYLITIGDFYRSSELFISLGDYKDSRQRIDDMDYQVALFLLKNGEFEKAISYFKVLARSKYKDSAELLLEAQYRLAAKQLESKEFAKAIAGFEQLAKNGYKDAKVMVQEAEYRFAQDCADKGDLATAYTHFKNLGEYKDSGDRVSSLAAKLYEASVANYRSDYAAETHFDLIAPYGRSADYIHLISAHKMIAYPIGLQKSNIQSLYDAVSAMGNFEDALAVSSSLKRLLSKYK